MSGSDAGLAAGCAGRLLGLRALPARLRPATLTVMTRQLRAWQRLGRALALARRVDPDPVWHFDDLAGIRWDEILHDLFNQVAVRNTFPLDVHRLDGAWWGFWEDPESNAVDLEMYLDYIPLAVQGLDEAALARHPALRLITGLLDESLADAARARRCRSLPAAVQKAASQKWRAPAARQAAWQRLRAIEAEPDLFPEPARLLPALVRWGCGCTGNLILDGKPTGWHEADYRYTWEQLPRIRAAWQAAQPVMEISERIIEWSEAADRNLIRLAFALMKGTHYEQLDW